MNKKIKNQQVFVTGDTHGNITRFSSKNFPEGRELTKNDIIFQLGDFGVVWNNTKDSIKNEEYWMKWLAKKPWITIVIPGNHEGYERIINLPETEIFGGKVWEYKTPEGSVYFAQAGSIFNINNKKFLTIRGALSIDKHLRMISISYWEEELLSYKEQEQVMNNLDKVNWDVDYVLTHTCPRSILYNFVDFNPNFSQDPTCDFFEFIQEKLNFNHWYFGHLHVNKNLLQEENGIGDFTCLFDNLEKIM